MGSVCFVLFSKTYCNPVTFIACEGSVSNSNSEPSKPAPAKNLFCVEITRSQSRQAAVEHRIQHPGRIHSSRQNGGKTNAVCGCQCFGMSLRDLTNQSAEMARAAKKAKIEPRLSPLLAILEEVGISYMQHSDQFVLRRAVSSMQASLCSTMKLQNKSQEFMQMLDEHFTESENLNAFLMPTNTHDSLCRILLGVLHLQVTLTDLLLSKLVQHICDEDEVEQQGTVGSICRLILHQFR